MVCWSFLLQRPLLRLIFEQTSFSLQIMTRSSDSDDSKDRRVAPPGCPDIHSLPEASSKPPVSPRTRKGKRPLEDPVEGRFEKRSPHTLEVGLEECRDQSVPAKSPHRGPSIAADAWAAREFFLGMVPPRDDEQVKTLNNTRLRNEGFLALGKAAVLWPEIARRLHRSERELTLRDRKISRQKEAAVEMNTALKKVKEEAMAAEAWKENLALALDKAEAEKRTLSRRVAFLEDHCRYLEVELERLHEHDFSEDSESSEGENTSASFG